MWDNLAYFLRAVVPVAEQAGVCLALHPDDPPVPDGTPALAGAAHIVSTLEQYRGFSASCHRRPTACCSAEGCVTEMQGVNEYDAIRQMGSIGKIVMVHFRNVRGEFPEIPGDLRR